MNDNGYYDYSDFTYSQSSPVIGGLKGLLGAVVGSLPGLAVLIILGKLGYIAALTGLLVAGGIVLGYTFMVKDDEVPLVVSIAICVLVFIAVNLIGVKIVWTWELAEIFKSYIPEYRDSMIQALMSEYEGITAADAESFLTDDIMKSLLKEDFGVETGTFGECFSNFGSLLDKIGMKGKYIWNVVESCGFGLLGGAGLFAKMAQN